jgi:TetR/AcrR family transcriptional regulator, regulator of mycofactocin system
MKGMVGKATALPQSSPKLGPNAELTSLREHKKQRTRADIEAAAWRLFERNGFDRTTTQDIAAAASVAPRTFFRYYESKEAVLFGAWRQDLDLLYRRVLERPAGEPLTRILEEGAVALAERAQLDRETHLRRARITAGSEHANRYQKQVVIPTWEAVLTDAIATRYQIDTAHDPRPRLFAAVTIAILASTGEAWATDSGPSSAVLAVRDAFERLRRAFAETDSL